jgi:lysophospholipase L1-like esterase
MLSVPDFPHFHDVTDAYPAAKAKLALAPSDQCAPYLGTDGPATRSAADARLAQYDASLKAACDDINAHEGANGRLYCTYNQALLAESDFTIKDMSTVDYFHPSLSGQAKMAADAWRADAWAARTLP